MSSTALWPICPRASSHPTVHGRSARPSCTTCSAPPAQLSAALTPSRTAPPCADTSSPSPPDSRARNADRCCTYLSTGPGPSNGPGSGPQPPTPRQQPEPPTAITAQPEPEMLGQP